MPAPTFDFTTRAVPIVQMGRSLRQIGNASRWGRARWGVDPWNKVDWEPAWTDLTCEIHEITTDTGRGGATDRFRPGTADIVASNVNQISEMIFPPVLDEDIGFRFEYVPQPPVPPEEQLQAPNAATVISNGWSFTDDFGRAGPHWIFPAVFGTGTAPSGSSPELMLPLKLVDEAIEPEWYLDSRYTAVGGVNSFVGGGVHQYTRTFHEAGLMYIEVLVDRMSRPGEVTAGSPHSTIWLYTLMNAVDQTANVARIDYLPAWDGDDNLIEIDLYRQDASGDRVSGLATPVVLNYGATGGVFPEPARWRFGPYPNLYLNGDVVASYLFPGGINQGRVGFGLGFEHGQRAAGGAPAPIRVLEAAGGEPGVEFTDTFTPDIGPGWTVGPLEHFNWLYDGMIAVDGGARPNEKRRDGGSEGAYGGSSLMHWRSRFEGDQFIEFTLDDLSQVETDVVSAETFLEVYLHWNVNAETYVALGVHYLGGWDGGDNVILWYVYTFTPGGGDDGLSGEINLGDTEGQFPEPVTWRFEVDLDGHYRVKYGDTLLADDQVPMGGITGTYIGVLYDWGTGLPAAGVVRPRPSFIDRLSAGLREPLGTEELGMWVRIGVDHATLGERWFFRGFVDALVPTYVPDRPDAVRIECIDSLGEAGRVYVAADRLPHRFAGAPTRIRQILNAAHWPERFRTIRDDATLMSRPPPGRAVDQLTLVAESCGGAVYGDPTTGDVVFKGQDWQAASASDEADAFITNFQPDLDDGPPRVCPVGWERSARRSDMTTRARFVSETSNTVDGEPIVTEWRTPAGENLYGVELYERTLLCITRERLHELNIRQLRLRHPNQFPRIEAVLLDAATSVEALDLMTTATFTKPSKYWCQLRRPDAWVFNRAMLVTGVRHRIRPTDWTCRLALDPSSVFGATGGRWGKARWGVDKWGRTR